MVFISVERWFSVWKPFDKAKYVTFNITIITVLSYTIISLFAFSWFPLAIHYNPLKPKPGERCQLLRPMVYKIFGTISVIFTYIGKRPPRSSFRLESFRIFSQFHSFFSAFSIFFSSIVCMRVNTIRSNVRWCRPVVIAPSIPLLAPLRHANVNNDSEIPIVTLPLC